jgi:hypothetical protein
VATGIPSGKISKRDTEEERLTGCRTYGKLNKTDCGREKGIRVVLAHGVTRIGRGELRN